MFGSGSALKGSDQFLGARPLGSAGPGFSFGRSAPPPPSDDIYSVLDQYSSQIQAAKAGTAKLAAQKERLREEVSRANGHLEEAKRVALGDEATHAGLEEDLRQAEAELAEVKGQADELKSAIGAQLAVQADRRSAQRIMRLEFITSCEALDVLPEGNDQKHQMCCSAEGS